MNAYTITMWKENIIEEVSLRPYQGNPVRDGTHKLQINTAELPRSKTIIAD